MLHFTLISLAWLLATAHAQIPTIAGCFNSSQPLKLVKTTGSNSVDTCNESCQAKNKYVLGLHLDDCWCGDELPPTYTNVGPRFCTSTCPGNSSYVCGGSDGSTSYFTLWLTELKATVPNLKSLSSSSIATSTATSTATSKATSTTNTGSPTSTGTKTKAKTTSTGSAAPASNGSQTKAESSGSGNGDQDLAIALGTILGFAAVALMALLFWWTWRRRRRTGKYARHNRESPDSASARLQPAANTAASSTAPEMSMRSPTDSETGGIGGPPYAPPIYVQQPTPATATLASHGSVEGLAPTGLLTPGSSYSRASSDTDPYYTPLEQPSISHLNQSELNSIRTRSQHRPSSSIGEDERDDVLSPLETIVRPERVSSRDRINNFDFAFENERYHGNENNTYEEQTPMPTMDMPGYFGTFYDDGR